MVAVSAPYGSCALSTPEQLSRRKDAVSRKLMAVSGIVLLSTLAIVSTVYSLSDPTVVLEQGAGCCSLPESDQAQENLDRSDHLLAKVKALLDQEQDISTDVRKIETASILDAAPPAPAVSAPAPAVSPPSPAVSAPAPAVSAPAPAVPADPAAAAAPVAPVDPAAAAVVAPVAAANPAVAAAGASSAAPVNAVTQGGAQARTQGSGSAAHGLSHKHDAIDRHEYYSGFVGGSFSGVDPEAPEHVPGVFDETKKARFVLLSAIFIAFCVGTFFAVRSIRNNTNAQLSTTPATQTFSHSGASRPYYSSSDPEYAGANPIGVGDVNSASLKLQQVEAQHAEARRQLQQQQQRIAFAQQQLNQVADKRDP